MDLFILPVRVYYEDTDAGGVVYHAAYVRFFERARTEYLRQLGFELRRLAAEESVLFVVRTMTLDFCRPAFLDDMLQVSATISTCGGASVDFTQTAVRAADGETVASAAVRVVCVKNGRATPLPVTLADKIKLL